MKLVEGKEYKIGIRDGKLGCSDAQDAYKEHKSDRSHVVP